MDNVRKQTKLNTIKKRKSQICKAYKIKVDRSRLNKEQKTWLRMIFIEAKWLYNHILSQEDIFKHNTKEKTISKLNKDREKEDIELKFITAQMKQGIHEKIKWSIKGLSAKKKKGSNGIGKLKFKSEVNCVPLKQYNVSYKILDKKNIKLQGLKKPIYCLGLQQIPEGSEFACGSILCVGNDYYITLTTYQENNLELEKTLTPIGIDFGIKNSIITSNGSKYDIKIKENNKLKKAQKNTSKKQKGSNNRRKSLNKIKKEYKKLQNRRKDKANKVIHDLKDNLVIMQDENIKGWHKGLFGKQVQNSALGRIKSELKKSETTIVVDRYFPSTKLCPICGNKETMSLEERSFSCSSCGFKHSDRDVKAALTILVAGLSIGTERINEMPVEPITATLWKRNIDFYFKEQVEAMKQEAQSFNLCVAHEETKDYNYLMEDVDDYVVNEIIPLIFLNVEDLKPIEGGATKESFKSSTDRVIENITEEFKAMTKNKIFPKELE